MKTDGPAPTFRVIGGNRRQLIVELDHTLVTAPGRRIAIGRDGVEAVRVALYDNHPPRVRLVVETDGETTVHPLVGPDGVLRMRLAERADRPADRPADRLVVHEQRLASAVTSVLATTAKENAATRAPAGRTPRPLARKPAPIATTRAAVAKRVVVVPPSHRRPVRRLGSAPAVAARPAPARPTAPRPAAPTASSRPTGTPKPAAAATPRPAAPGATPTPMAIPEPSLNRRLSTSYSFPIDRDKITGRKNPFKPIKKGGKSLAEGTAPKSSAPAVAAAPVLPAAPKGGPSFPQVTGPAAIPALPGAAALPAGNYSLGGVMVGGGGAPMALISVDGRAYTVGLNERLPGNARVTAIKVDHVILSASGQEIRLDLKR